MQNSEINVLVVDDELEILDSLKDILKIRGYNTHCVNSAESAVDVLEEFDIDLLLTDLEMPGSTGLDLIRHVRATYPTVAIIMITGHATIETAVDVMGLGASGFLPKPFDSKGLFKEVDKALESLAMKRAMKDEIQRSGDSRLFREIIGDSPVMQKIFTFIRKAAVSPVTVLIQGESGTGKELVARAIHYASPRAGGPFIPVNCGSIPENLLESELFGHERGVFTGANTSRDGFFQAAHNGTLFLDEIGEISESMQVKLLRVLQDKEVFRLGSRKGQKVNVRVLAATNKNLESMVKLGKLREDLYYRLNVVNVTLPPLRERGNDIILLASMFANRFAKEMSIDVPDFSSQVINTLKNYNWPGNVRELENLMQNLVIMTDDEVIEISDLPVQMRPLMTRQPNLDRTLAEVEEEYIKAVLARVDGNKKRASEILGIDRKTLYRKLKEIFPDEE